MRTLLLVPVALCAAAVMAATAVSAAPAQSRDNAIRQCVAEAKAAAPRGAGGVAGPDSAAMETYKSCIWKRGLRP
jgi:hypothetical protein